MSPTVLATKLHIPRPASSFVSRRRLLDRLDEGLEHKLTLLSAPPGFGKTTLLSEWVHNRGQPTAWLSLDEGDNDPVCFLSYLIAALRNIHTEIGQVTRSLLQSPQQPPVESAVATLINEISGVSKDFCLILDDYHVIESRTIHTAINYLLERLPSRMHFFISGRADPPIPLARLRVQRQLDEIRAADLRFTSEEAATFLNQVMNLSLSHEDVSTLETRTEGWIAGLQMAVLSIRDRQDVTSFISSFGGSHRFVLDYLTEEVLQQQPDRIKQFLLRTSILDRMCASLCDAVTGMHDSQTTLEMLDHANMFIVALDDERRWYRYHHLFADLLRHYPQRDYPDLIPGLHRRAADWFEQNGFTTEALGHALAAGDRELAAHLVEQNAMGMLMRGEIMNLLKWIGAIGSSAQDRPWLRIYQAWALLLSGQIQAAEQSLPATVPEFDGDRQDKLGHIVAIRAYVAALRGDVPLAIKLAEEALTYLPSEALSVRCVVSLVLGGARLLAANLVEAELAFSQAAKLGQESGNVHMAVPAMAAVANLRVIHGDLHRAAGIDQDAIRLATPQHGLPLPIAASGYAGLGSLLYEWNDLAAAADHLEKSLELSKLWGNADSFVFANIALARLRQAQNDISSAWDLLGQAEQTAARSMLTPTMTAELVAQRVRFSLLRGDIGSAARSIEEGGLVLDGEIGYQNEVEYTSLARVLLAQHDWEGALDLLNRILQSAQNARRIGRVIELLILQALAFQSKDDTPQAIAVLTSALHLAQPEGYVRIFLDEGEPMGELLRRAGSRGIVPAYVAKLLSAAGDTGSPALQPLIEPLTEREIEVLQLIAAGLSNQDIAAKLVVSIGTVKAHTSSIYRKLDATSRTQAAARARALKLI